MDNTAGPTIFKSSNIQQTVTQGNLQGFFRRNIIKIGLVVLVTAVLAEVVFGAVTLFSPASVRNLNILQPSINELGSAQISLVPDRTSYKRNEAVMIDVKLFTGGYTTDSVDLVVKYDPAFLQPKNEGFASVGQIYEEYPGVQVDNQNGLIGISGITSQNGAGFSGVGNFARLNFTALKDGQTEVTIDFQPDSTGDSNVVLSGSMQDLLGQVNNAIIEISESASGARMALGGQSCESFTQYCQDSAGSVGTQVCKAGTINKQSLPAGSGSCGYDPVVTVSCEVCKTQ